MMKRRKKTRMNHLFVFALHLYPLWLEILSNERIRMKTICLAYINDSSSQSGKTKEH